MRNDKETDGGHNLNNTICGCTVIMVHNEQDLRHLVDVACLSSELLVRIKLQEDINRGHLQEEIITQYITSELMETFSYG